MQSFFYVGGAFAALHFYLYPTLWIGYQIALGAGCGWVLGLVLAPPVSNEVAFNPLWWGVFSPAVALVFGLEDEELGAFSPVPPVFSMVMDDY